MNAATRPKLSIILHRFEEVPHENKQLEAIRALIKVDGRVPAASGNFGAGAETTTQEPPKERRTDPEVREEE
jgi:hypothetical protein